VSDGKLYQVAVNGDVFAGDIDDPSSDSVLGTVPSIPGTDQVFVVGSSVAVMRDSAVDFVSLHDGSVTTVPAKTPQFGPATSDGQAVYYTDASLGIWSLAPGDSAPGHPSATLPAFVFAPSIDAKKGGLFFVGRDQNDAFGMYKVSLTDGAGAKLGSLPSQAFQIASNGVSVFSVGLISGLLSKDECKQKSPWALFSVPVAGGAVTTLTSLASHVGGGGLLADDNYVFVRDGCDDSVVRIPTGGGTIIPVVPAKVAYGQKSFLLDGAYLYFHSLDGIVRIAK
jgi:hypothetical protein